MEENRKKHIPAARELPVVPLRDTVLFPGTNLQFEVYGPAAFAAVKKAMDGDQRAFFTAQKDATLDAPRFGDLYAIGCVGRIRQVRRVMDRLALNVSIDGAYRAVISKRLPSVECLNAAVLQIAEREAGESNYVTAMMRQGREQFRRWAALAHPDAHVELPPVNGPGALADLIANEFPLEPDEKQDLLEETDQLKRLEAVNVIILQEIELLELEGEINEKVQEKLDKGQREYYLREQMHTIAEELGEEDDEGEYEKYMRRIGESAMPDECKKKLTEETGRLRTMPPASPDANVSRTYLDRCLSLPWGKYSKDNLDIAHAKRILERDHYGMADVKERIVELIAAMAVAPDIKGQIICFAGPPGVGKTSVVRSIATALGRKYQRISLGGVHDEAEIRGHRRTYIGSMPGRIINAVIDAGTANPVILLDEIDKTAGDFRGDPSSALLEALDGEQNNTFTDHYIDMPFDLSKVLFITTANDKYAIPGPLQDRMEIIDLYSYTAEEKFHIAKKHLIKRQLKEHNIKPASLRITDKAIRLMIDGYTREAGVRQLERQIAKICRKTSVFLAEDPACRTVVNEKNLADFLGARKYRPEDETREDAVGLVNGLAWTSVGGELLTVETAVLDGTGKIELTGSLGDEIGRAHV